MGGRTKKWLKRVGYALLSPFILLAILIVLLYLPPVQNQLKKQFVKYASKQTGMQIAIDRISLSFPLDLSVHGVSVISSKDTLLVADKAIVDLGLKRLLQGEIKVEGFTLSKVDFNSSHLIKGIRLKGKLDRFFLRSEKVGISREEMLISAATLKDADVRLSILDTTETKTKEPSKPIRWKFYLSRLKLQNVSFHLEQPLDSTHLSASIGEGLLTNGLVDLPRSLYRMQHIIVNKGTFNYDSNQKEPFRGFDPTHLALRGISFTVDSFRNQSRYLAGIVRKLSLTDRSGITIDSMKGRLQADNRAMQVTGLELNTPHSELRATAKADWLMLREINKGSFISEVKAYIGKQDVLLLTGASSGKLAKSYPFRAIALRGMAEGHNGKINISKLTADLPGAFSFSSKGRLANVTDRVNRSGQLLFCIDAQNLDFLTALIGSYPNGPVRLPQGMQMEGKVAMKGEQFLSRVTLKDDKGEVKVDGAYNVKRDSYMASVGVNNLQLKHFLPDKTLSALTASFKAEGEGTDIFSPKTKANAAIDLQQLQYGNTSLSGLALKAELLNSQAKVALSSEHKFLGMDATLNMLLNKKLLEGDFAVNVHHVDLYHLGLLPHPLKEPVTAFLKGSAGKSGTSLNLKSGDMELYFESDGSVNQFVKEATLFSELLTKEIQQKRLDQKALREAMPSTRLLFSAGNANPLARYLALSKIYFHEMELRMGTSSAQGLHGVGSVRSVMADSIKLDTVRLIVRQDTAGIHLHAGVVNNASNKQYVFQSYVDGIIRNDNAELMLRYLNAKGETGALLGVRAHLQEEGLMVNLFPEKPTLLFRSFTLNRDNHIFIGNDKRISANLELQDKNGMGLFIHSVENVEAQQDLQAEIRNLDLKEVVNSVPYMPDIGGILSAKAEYLQKESHLQVKGDADISKLMYAKRLVGNVNLKATYTPGETNEHQVDAMVGYNGREVITAAGIYRSEKQQSMDIHARLKDLPLSIANAFVPDDLARFAGALNGEVTFKGTTESPQIAGEVKADTASVFIVQAGARLKLDDKKIAVTDNRVVFDDYHIYAVGKNPLTISGGVDLKKLQSVKADLKLTTRNYQLMNSRRTHQSLVYGKLFVDLNSTIRGPLDALVMRGDMRLLGTTDATYILRDSPLAVKDRLGEMVTFVNFEDTAQVQKKEPKSATLSGLDMILNVQVEPAVRIKAELSPDGEDRVELEGGGDLSLHYTPQGDMLLYGRYTMSGGLLKYTLPVIPLKSFVIKDGSYVEWSGNMMDPVVNCKAVERLRASVTNENQTSRQVNFDVSVSIKNRLQNLGMVFDLEAPEDMAVQNQLLAMSDEERSKQAITMLVSGMYMPGSMAASSTGGINMGGALNSFLQGQIAGIAGSALKKVDITFGMETYNESSAQGMGRRTDYSFRFARRFYNDRIRIIIGGKISTGETAEEKQSFIDNISLEYRLDTSGTRYVRLFYDKNYQSLLEGEIIETGAGVVLRKKMRKLGELFIFKNKNQKKESR
ncbi:translocation/assembly module TamB domain-containing protein [Bacteroides sedimenti]